MLQPSLRSLLLGMAQARGGGGCSMPLWGSASTAKNGPHLTGKKYDDVPVLQIRRGETALERERRQSCSSSSCPLTKTPRCLSGSNVKQVNSAQVTAQPWCEKGRK